MIQNSNESDIRKGCVDVWNAYMVKGADFVLGSDIPICPCTAIDIPRELISYVNAKHIHEINRKKDPDYHVDAFVHFYYDDYKFEGPRVSVWLYPDKVLEILRHFSGVITVDFSTNADFPDPIKRYNTYRMRALGRWLGVNGIPVINNVRWGTEETWGYCFDGIPYNSIVAIGTVASEIDEIVNRPDFDTGLFKMVDLLRPHTIIIYGSANYDCFRALKDMGIKIVEFPSDMNKAFMERKGGAHVKAK
jgi:hypothetical protein